MSSRAGTLRGPGWATRRGDRRGVALLAVGAALVLSGCGTRDVAATVDGRVISESNAQQAAAQINQVFHPQNGFSTRDAVGLLISAPMRIQAAAASGHPQSESMARAQLPGLQDPNPATVELVRADAATQYLSQAQRLQILTALKKARIVVNPRYGSFDLTQGAMQATTPDWIKASATQQP